MIIDFHKNICAMGFLNVFFGERCWWILILWFGERYYIKFFWVNKPVYFHKGSVGTVVRDL